MTATPRATKTVGAVFLALALGGTVTGCGTPGPATYRSATVRASVARAVLDAMNNAGLPVEADAVGCHGPDTTETITCYATTTDEPTEGVTATFARQPTPSACPGTLTVTVGSTVLTRVTENPCR